MTIQRVPRSEGVPGINETGPLDRFQWVAMKRNVATIVVPIILSVAGCFPSLVKAADPNTFQITEFMARNDSGLKDGFGQVEDWIEIYNRDEVSQSLGGYYLTDDESDLKKWRFPEVTVPGKGYLVVFASGQDIVDPAGNLHTNFSLGGKGEYLALVLPRGNLVESEIAPHYPEQFSDISYGISNTGDGFRFFDTPTPGSANGRGFFGVVGDTRFSIDRSFCDEPIDVEITASPPQALIRYTLDGSKPSDIRGQVYTEPIHIDQTTTLRAVASVSGWIDTNVDTHTYIFVDQVATQPAYPRGWPSDWGYDSEVGGAVPADYEMDPRVVSTTLPGYSVPEALLSIGTLSVVMPQDDFIDATQGIYANPRSTGSAWERECSLELIFPDSTEGFQYDCKIEMHGNSSRRPWRLQKHFFRLTFTSEYGPGKLRYPLFPHTEVDEFNKLVLRGCFTDSWALVSWASSRYRPNDSQYIRDAWMKESLAAMGQPSSFGRYVHLYVNGLYWGLYNLTERIEDDFFASHLGGQKEDWEINEDFGSPGSRWNQMMSMANAGLTSTESYEAIQAFVDLENLADYLLLHFYADAEDWPHHNGYAAANAISGDGKFRFFVWDQEIVLDNFAIRKYDTDSGNSSPSRLFQRLRENEDFRLLFADRVHKHLFNDGALSLEASVERYARIADEIDQAIVAESARWGDVATSTAYGNSINQPSPLDDIDDLQYPPAPHAPDVYFTREDSWVIERDTILYHYFPVLHDPADSRSTIRELRAANLYPSIDAPEFGQHGGQVPQGDLLEIFAMEGTVYYTLDGTDPRLLGSVIDAEDTVLVEQGSPKWALVPDGPIDESWMTDPAFDRAGWRSGFGGVGYEASAGYESWIGIDVLSEMRGVNTTCLVHIPFECADDPATFNTMRLDMFYDDGFVAYLNGVEVARAYFNGTPQWNSAASGTHECYDAESFDISSHIGVLHQGVNVLAIHGLNTPSTSSDFLIGAELIAGFRDAAVSSLSLSAIEYTGSIELSESTHVKARCLVGDTWSALTEATFTIE